MIKELDVLIIGAGVSGIGMACYMEKYISDSSYAILEQRNEIGGTWDLFRYPGVRSDSDMLTFGYKFNPWNGTSILADGTSIKNYVSQTAETYGVNKNIIYQTKALSANWNSSERYWYIDTIHKATGISTTYKCKFLISASGYYDSEKGYLPKFKGYNTFKGAIIHPQHWPEDIDYTNKKVIVIGSGATAITIVPAMADKASHVTMLQRSPTYVYSIPSQDHLAIKLRKLFSEETVYRFARWRNIFLQRLVYRMSRKFPKTMRSFFLSKIKKQLNKKEDIKHFSPKYNPWDQRVAAIPDSNLFNTINKGKASVVTDQIEAFTKHGILLKSGKELTADIIVTATGLKLQVLGGMKLMIDQQEKMIHQKMTYKSVLVQDIPNFAYLFGYTNSSWTLKIDIAADYVVRLLKEIKNRKATVVIPRTTDEMLFDENVLDSLNSGYIQRGGNVLPRQGKGLPWRVLHNYNKDKKMLKLPITDKALEWD